MLEGCLGVCSTAALETPITTLCDRSSSLSEALLPLSAALELSSSFPGFCFSYVVSNRLLCLLSILDTVCSYKLTVSSFHDAFSSVSSVNAKVFL